MKRDDACHNLGFNQGFVNFGTDNITAKHSPRDYAPNPIIPSGFFLEFFGGGVPFPLLSGTTMTLL